MSRSAFTDAHQVMVKALTDARLASGLMQEQVAHRLGKHQSFVSNIERGQRRVDLIEFYAIAKAIGADPVALFSDIATALPKKVSI